MLLLPYILRLSGMEYVILMLLKATYDMEFGNLYSVNYLNIQIHDLQCILILYFHISYSKSVVLRAEPE